jgi:hypothetical protein
VNYILNSAVLTFAIGAMTLAACKQRTLSATNSTATPSSLNFDSELVKNLPKLSAKTVEKFYSVIRDVQITDVYDDNYRFYIPWGSISENCNRRASAVDYVIARLVDNPKLTAKELTLDSAEAQRFPKWASEKKMTSANVLVTGPLNIQYKTVIWNKDFSGTTRVSERSDLVAWDKHVASVVNLEGEIVVLDLSVSPNKPIAVKDWINKVAHKDAVCPEVSRDEFQKRNSYWFMRWQFDMPFPATKELCGFTFNGSFEVNPESTTKEADISNVFDGIRGLLKTNFASIPGHTFNNITPLELAYSGVLITDKFEAGRNFGEEAFCKAMNNGFRFCKKYQ